VLPGIGRMLGAIASFIVRILEGMSGVGINHDLDFFPQLLQRLFEFLDIVYRDTAVLATKYAEDGRINLFQLFGIGGQVTIVDDRRRERWFLESHVERISATHTPAN